MVLIHPSLVAATVSRCCSSKRTSSPPCTRCSFLVGGVGGWVKGVGVDAVHHVLVPCLALEPRVSWRVGGRRLGATQLFYEGHVSSALDSRGEFERDENVLERARDCLLLRLRRLVRFFLHLSLMFCERGGWVSSRFIIRPAWARAEWSEDGGRAGESRGAEERVRRRRPVASVRPRFPLLLACPARLFLLRNRVS